MAEEGWTLFDHLLWILLSRRLSPAMSKTFTPFTLYPSFTYSLSAMPHTNRAGFKHRWSLSWSPCRGSVSDPGWCRASMGYMRRVLECALLVQTTKWLSFSLLSLSCNVDFYIPLPVPDVPLITVSIFVFFCCHERESTAKAVLLHLSSRAQGYIPYFSRNADGEELWTTYKWVLICPLVLIDPVWFGIDFSKSNISLYLQWWRGWACETLTSFKTSILVTACQNIIDFLLAPPFYWLLCLCNWHASQRHAFYLLRASANAAFMYPRRRLVIPHLDWENSSRSIRHSVFFLSYLFNNNYRVLCSNQIIIAECVYVYCKDIFYFVDGKAADLVWLLVVFTGTYRHAHRRLIAVFMHSRFSWLAYKWLVISNVSETATWKDLNCVFPISCFDLLTWLFFF